MAYLLGNGLLAHIYLLFLLLAAGSHVQLVHGGLRAEGLVEGTTEVISHSQGLVARLEGLLVLGNNSDISLRVETVDADEVKVIQAHTLVLSLQSRVFEEMLRNHNSSTLVLQETAECTAVFEKFIRYLYCGELTLQLDQATPLHRLAAKYGISSLQQGLTQYTSQNLASDSLGGHVVGWYQYAVSVGDTALRDNCLQFLSWNLSAVLQSDEWPSVSVDLLMARLQRSDLVLKNELELFEALEIWLTQNDPDTLTAENALRLVRYAMIPPRELFRLQQQSPIMTRYHESVRDLLYISYQFHSASPLHLAKFFDVNCSLFVPRNYLSSMWGSQWIISNPARDDRSTSFQTQLGPSGFDSSKRVTWNALFSPRWLPLSMRPMYTEQGAMQPPRPDGGNGIARPRIIITPATSSADFAGVSFQKTVLILTKQKKKLVVRHIFGFHQSTEEVGDFLAGVDMQNRTSEYLVDGSLYLQIIVKPIYQTLIATKK
ncbi:BTB/POZ domain-containing protein 17-like [Sinocyclocheilus rhinocerous]|uniref:BTB/POZ domain-containing protein 17-like n=1 Tax=Sinocyclocheilus rhinocerous TaxID=307959 RepID=UPI0007B84D3C|nr:PREDICTED: BTB/POZ domain-containing protein 17-like [Sinocyclocheilus rhinocerous]